MKATLLTFVARGHGDEGLGARRPRREKFGCNGARLLRVVWGRCCAKTQRRKCRLNRSCSVGTRGQDGKKAGGRACPVVEWCKGEGDYSAEERGEGCPAPSLAREGALPWSSSARPASSAGSRRGGWGGGKYAYSGGWLRARGGWLGLRPGATGQRGGEARGGGYSKGTERRRRK